MQLLCDVERSSRIVLAMGAALWIVGGCATAPATTERTVDVGGGRRLWVACSGTGSPTVVLVAGAKTGGDSWSFVQDDAGIFLPSAASVLPVMARTTRVCTYDRPQTTRMDGTATTSTPVSQPTTAADGVADLQALLVAAGEPGPYLLAGRSWAGLIVRLFAGTYPEDVAGVVAFRRPCRRARQLSHRRLHHGCSGPSPSH